MPKRPVESWLGIATQAMIVLTVASFNLSCGHPIGESIDHDRVGSGDVWARARGAWLSSGLSSVAVVRVSGTTVSGDIEKLSAGMLQRMTTHVSVAVYGMSIPEFGEMIEQTRLMPSMPIVVDDNGIAGTDSWRVAGCVHDMPLFTAMVTLLRYSGCYMRIDDELVYLHPGPVVTDGRQLRDGDQQLRAGPTGARREAPKSLLEERGDVPSAIARGRKVAAEFENVSLVAAIVSSASEAGANVVIHPNVLDMTRGGQTSTRRSTRRKDLVTISLTDVTFEDALSAICDGRGLVHRRLGNVHLVERAQEARGQPPI